MNPSRLEAFSDGVFAIAITLLVLDIHVPDPTSTTDLAQALADQWPTYVAYAVSFLTIGIIWINHHAMMRRLARVDHGILVLNLLLLLFVALLPFTTALMAAYLRESSGEHLAAALYSGSCLLMGVAFAMTNRHALVVNPDLLSTPVSASRRRAILARAVAGVAPYAIATALAAISSYVTLGICAAVALYYALPFAAGGQGEAVT
jgi:TMEM175 potassium channel family protein